MSVPSRSTNTARLGRCLVTTDASEPTRTCVLVEFSACICGPSDNRVAPTGDAIAVEKWQLRCRLKGPIEAVSCTVHRSVRKSPSQVLPSRQQGGEPPSRWRRERGNARAPPSTLIDLYFRLG